MRRRKIRLHYIILVAPRDASSSQAEVKSNPGEPGEPDDIISFLVEPGRASASPAEIESVSS